MNDLSKLSIVELIERFSSAEYKYINFREGRGEWWAAMQAVKQEAVRRDDELAATIKRIRDEVATLERSLSVSDKQVAAIVMGNG